MATNRSSAYLDEALASVAAQTWDDHEIVVVDDGSPVPDEIARIVARFPSVRLLRREPSGVAAARNAAERAARGQLIAFLDDDDRWHPECLRAHVTALRAAPDAVASYCRIQTIDATGTSVLAPGDQTAVDSQADIAARRTGIFAGNIVVRRTAFRAIGGFAEGLRRAEDLDLVLSLAERGPFVFASDGLVDYRAHDDNTTRRYRELVEDVDAVLRRHRARAVDGADADLVAAFDESIARNERFAWWSATRSARAALAEHALRRAAAELAWAAGTAPRGLATGLWRRLRGVRD